VQFSTLFLIEEVMYAPSPFDVIVQFPTVLLFEEDAMAIPYVLPDDIVELNTVLLAEPSKYIPYLVELVKDEFIFWDIFNTFFTRRIIFIFVFFGR
jgi:hypothetical protein